MAINKKYLDLEGLEHYEATIKSRLGAEANTRMSTDNTLQAQINGLASGSPLVASSTSGMTDTTRVYVNTTDGHWYYYNGGAWTDGGVYQATAISSNDPEIDGRNTKLDNTGLSFNANALSEIEGLEMGNIVDHGSNAAIIFNNSSARVRTPEDSPITIEGNSFTLINLDPSTYKAWVWYCNENKVRVDGFSGWITDKIFQSVIPTGYSNIYILFGRVDNANITVSEVTNNFRILSGSSPVTKQSISESSKGNLRNLLRLHAGAIRNDGSIDYSVQFMATGDILEFDYDLYIPYNNVIKVDMLVYDENNIFVKRLNGVSNDTKGHVIKSGTRFRLGLNYINSPSPYPDTARTAVENTTLYQNLVVLSLNDYREEEFEKLRASGYSEDPQNLKYSMDLNIGDINANGLSYQSNENRRLITTTILHYDFDVVIPQTNSWMFYLYTYDDASGTNQTAAGWQYPSAGDITIPANTFWRMVITVHRNSTDPIYNLYDNNVFKAIKLYKKVIDNSNPIVYNPNMRSVAHQGFSITSETYGNCRLSSYVGAKQHGFDYAECDLQWTSDMIPVCSHDPTFVSGDETIDIRQKTWAELQNYTFHGETLASFEQVLSKCKELGLGLYIDKSWFDQTHFNIMSAIVDKYQMQDNVYWLLQGAIQPTFDMISSWYPNAKYSVVLNTGTTAPTEAQIQAVVDFANNNKTVNNYISIDVNHGHFTVEQLASLSAQLTHGVQLECWTIDNTTRYKEVLPYLCGITSNKICYNDVYEDLLS